MLLSFVLISITALWFYNMTGMLQLCYALIIFTFSTLIYFNFLTNQYVIKYYCALFFLDLFLKCNNSCQCHHCLWFFLPNLMFIHQLRNFYDISSAFLKPKPRNPSAHSSKNGKMLPPHFTAIFLIRHKKSHRSDFFYCVSSQSE